MTTPEITDDQIRALRDEAGAAGDTLGIRCCADALEGDDDARETCAEMLADAQAAAYEPPTREPLED